MESHTKRLLFIELFIIAAVICGAFFIPFKEIPVYTVENYTVTEYRRESYTELVQYEASRTGKEDQLLNLRLELNGNQFWGFWIKRSGEKIGFYASVYDLENSKPAFLIPSKPESTITMEWVTLWPSSKEIHALLLPEEAFSIPGNLTNDPDGIRSHIIGKALENKYGTRGEIVATVAETVMLSLMHEDAEKKDTPMVLNVSFSHQWDEIEMATREVTRYRSVPVEIEKQRPLILTPRYSMWQLIFSGKALQFLKGEL